MEIYQPSDDSHFFQDFLKKYLKNLKSQIEVDRLRNPPSSSPILTQPAFLSLIKMLDMGTGSGILAKTASEFIDKKYIITVDINPDAIKNSKKLNFKSIQSNLFEKIKDKFDLIIFNAPYLPKDNREPKESQVSTTGGKRGDEISVKFLKQAIKHLNENGKIFLLISSLTPIEKIKKFNPKIVARKKLFQEELLILEFKP